MSFENNLKRLADASERQAEALEELLSKFGHIGQAIDDAAKEPAPVPKAEPAPAVAGASTPATTAPVAAPPPPAPPVQATAAPTPPPAPPTPAAEAPAPTPPAALTPEALNAALAKEAQRLGGPDQIRTLMAAAPFGVQSINDLAVEQYQPLIDAAKEL